MYASDNPTQGAGLGMQSKVSASGGASEHVPGTADVDSASLPPLADARQLIVDAAEHLQVRYLHPSPQQLELRTAPVHEHWGLVCICSAAPPASQILCITLLILGSFMLLNSTEHMASQVLDTTPGDSAMQTVQRTHSCVFVRPQ